MSDDAKAKQDCFAALVEALRTSFPIMKDETAGGQPMLRLQHGGVIFNLVLSLSRDQHVNGDWL